MTHAIPEHEMSLDDCWNRIGVWSQDNASCPELEHYIHCRNCKRYSAAGRQVLERPAPDEYRQQWARRFTDTEQPNESETNSALLFRLGDEWLAIDSTYVNEIIQVRSIHSLPHRTNNLVKGLINVRGELKLCVSIGSILQLERAREVYSSDHEILERMIFIEKDAQGFVFPVSEVHGIHHYSDNVIQAVPTTVAKAKNSFTTSILPWNNQHVGILDHELLFYALSRGLQ